MPWLDRGGLWHRTAVRRAVWRLAVPDQARLFSRAAIAARRPGKRTPPYLPTWWTMICLASSLERGQKWWGYHQHWYRGRHGHRDLRANYFRAFAHR